MEIIDTERINLTAIQQTASAAALTFADSSTTFRAAINNASQTVTNATMVIGLPTGASYYLTATITLGEE